ncbi:MAG: RlmE family RNA methyltransferase [Bacteroidia bacterium]|nr:RlmE family RNA methyltransferase [Bacteroidia bacterium]MCX7764954.1 RlmE family RNA methyltransferase [Bacteroidia bacterium]MDW8057117.1 RlmE family RNA methyltransferase [Bacteroidia bacterium]
MTYIPEDYYFRRAKKEGFLARSVYKLQAIDEKYHLLKKGMWVVDLGAAPGSWSQYVLAKVGPEGKVFAIDIQPIKLSAPNLHAYLLDVFSQEVEALLASASFDGLLSDMAPATTGSRLADQARSAALVARSLFLAEKYLRPNGFWVAKLLEGPAREELTQKARTIFQTVHVFRPPATRKGSSECFLIGLKKRP